MLRILLATLLVLYWVPLTADAATSRLAKTVEKREWQKVSTPNFVIISDSKLEDVTELAKELEYFRNFVLLITGAAETDTKPVKIYAPANKNSFHIVTKQIKQANLIAGLFINNINGNYAVVRLSKKKNNRYPTEVLSSKQIIFHEYAHYLDALQSRVSTHAWYREGFAEYLSTITFSEDRIAVLGYPVLFRLRYLFNMPWMDIEKVLKSDEINLRRDGAEFYAQSWLMVHYFNSNDERKEQLREFFISLKDRSIDEAFEKVFAMSYKDFGKDLKDYMKETFNRTAPTKAFTFSSPFQAADIKSEILADDAALFEIGELLLNATNDRENAAALFERSIEINPGNAGSMAGLANVYMFEDLTKASAMIQKATAADPNNGMAQTVQGHIFSRIAESIEDTSSAQRKTALTTAIKSYQIAIDNIDKKNTEALYGLSVAQLAANNFNQAVAAAERAYAYAPTTGGIQTQLIAAYLNNGDKESAKEIITRVKLGLHQSQERLAEFDKWLEQFKDLLK